VTEPHALQASAPTVAGAKRLAASTFVNLLRNLFLLTDSVHRLLYDCSFHSSPYSEIMVYFFSSDLKR